ncbi:MAG: hypothetical protein JO296_18325 [Pseudonocardiales bacterium]|nr:hypothetical protein [Pseudonocardiales bacterium]
MIDSSPVGDLEEKPRYLTGCYADPPGALTPTDPGADTHTSTQPGITTHPA